MAFSLALLNLWSRCGGIWQPLGAGELWFRVLIQGGSVHVFRKLFGDEYVVVGNSEWWFRVHEGMFWVALFGLLLFVHRLPQLLLSQKTEVPTILWMLFSNAMIQMILSPSLHANVYLQIKLLVRKDESITDNHGCGCMVGDHHRQDPSTNKYSPATLFLTTWTTRVSFVAVSVAYVAK